MKKIFLMGIAALCALTMNAQKMQVKSGGAVVFERGVKAIDEVTFEDADPEAVEVAWKDAVLTLDYSDEVSLADWLLLNNVELADVSVVSSKPSVVAVKDGRLVAKDFGYAIVRATAEGVSQPAQLAVNVESNALLYVEDVLTISGEGTVMTGTVVKGKFHKGQSILWGSLSDETYAANGGMKEVTPIDIRGFHVSLNEATEGDEVGFLVDLDKTLISSGDIVMAQGNREVVRTKKIVCDLYAYTKDEGGRHTPFFNGYKPYFYLEGGQVQVEVKSLGTVDGEAVEMVMPGTTARGLVLEVAEEGKSLFGFIGQEAYLREAGKTIAKLTITGF